MVQHISNIGAGDLGDTIAPKGNDEIAEILKNLKRMQDLLSGVVTEARGAADIIRTGTAAVSKGSDDLSTRTQSQASALLQASTAIQSLSDIVNENLKQAHDADALTRSATLVATEGRDAVEQVISTMEVISESAGKIQDIISVIDGITFQTNLLALNASVEAARAGEMGRGFAVVAAEVRNLASRSYDASKQIRQLISESKENVDRGNLQVHQAGQKMQGIFDSILQIKGIVELIATAATEQNSGLEQINAMVHELEGVTQKNTALVEHTASSAKLLDEQAAKLREIVSYFH